MIWSTRAVHDTPYKLWDLVISTAARAACWLAGREARATSQPVSGQAALCGPSDTAHQSEIRKMVLP